MNARSLTLAIWIAAAAVGPWAQADPAGYPFDLNTNATTWKKIAADWQAFGVLVSGVQERVEMVGTNLIAPLSIVDTFPIWVSNAPSFYDYTDATGGVHRTTNWTPVVASVTVTNCLGPFAWTAPDGSARTVVPPLSASAFGAIDTKIAEIVPYFVSTNGIGSDGTINAWWRNRTTNEQAAGYFYGPAAVPAESLGGLFARQGIGIVYGPMTNSAGWITGASNALWTAIFPAWKTRLILARCVADWEFTATGFPEEYGVNGAYRYKLTTWENHLPGQTHFGFAMVGELWDPPWITVATDGRWTIGVWYGGDFSAGPAPTPATNVWVNRWTGTVATNAEVTSALVWNKDVAAQNTAGGQFGNNLYGTVAYLTTPSLHYTRAGTNALESLSVTVQGYGIAPGVPYGYWDYTTMETQEVVALAAPWAPLRLAWAYVTNMIVTGPLAFGDSVEITWTNRAVYGGSPSSVNRAMIDERIRAVKPLRVTFGMAKYAYSGGYGYQNYGARVNWTNPPVGPEASTNWAYGYGSYGYTNAPYSVIKPLAYADLGRIALKHVNSQDGLRDWASLTYSTNTASEGYVGMAWERDSWGVDVWGLSGKSKTIDLYLYGSLQGVDGSNSTFAAYAFPLAERDRQVKVYSVSGGTAASVALPAAGYRFGVTDMPSLSHFHGTTAPNPGETYYKGANFDQSLVVLIFWTPSW